jgi:membrane dipeptidase
MRHLIAFVLAIAPSLAMAQARGRGPETEEQLIARARGIHKRVIAIDTHVDIPGSWGVDSTSDPLTMNAQVNLKKMREGGLDGAFFAVYVGQGARTPAGDSGAKASAMAKFAGIHRMADTLYPKLVAIAYTPADVPRISAQGKLIALVGIENGWVIGRDLSLIKKYYDLGARYMTLAHTSHNDICDSANPAVPEHNGLSELGRKVVPEMNRVGMMVDISHVSKACMMQATALSKSPVIASHSSTRFLADHPRNMDDEQLIALKKNGGVMQTVAYAGYVTVQPGARTAALRILNESFYPPDSAALAARGAGAQRGRAAGAAPPGGAGAAAGAPAAGGGNRGGGGGRGGRTAAEVAEFVKMVKARPIDPNPTPACGTDASGFTTAPARAGGAGGGGNRGAAAGGGGRGPLAPDRQAAYDRIMRMIDSLYPAAPPADVKKFVDHIDHAVAIMGVDHVGISSDFDGGGGVNGWRDACESFNVTLELVRRGYTEAQIGKFWSGNILRVMGENQRIAKTLQAAKKP